MSARVVPEEPLVGSCAPPRGEQDALDEVTALWSKLVLLDQVCDEKEASARRAKRRANGETEAVIQHCKQDEGKSDGPVDHSVRSCVQTFLCKSCAGCLC